MAVQVACKMITLQNITKSYGSTIALDNVSVDFPGKMTTALIGPSGCGKSTALRIIAGLTTPDSGQVTISGTSLDADTIYRLRKTMGYVIQEGGLFPHLTCFDNVCLLPAQEGWDQGRIEARVEELADLVRLSRTLLNAFPQQLSGGQRQRVSIMRALMHDPGILLLDEPLGALDSIVRAELQRDLRDIFERLQKTVVIITHDLAEAAYFSESLVLLRNGKIEQSGPLRSLASEPGSDFVTEFIRAQGDAASAFIEATS